MRDKQWIRRWRRGKVLEWLLYAVVVVGFWLVVGFAVIGWLEESAGAVCVEPGKAERMGGYLSEGLLAPEARDEAILPCGQDDGTQDDAKIYLGRYYITGYDVCLSCCGKTDGVTASGTAATVGRTCALNGMPFGSRIFIDGLGERTVEDRGGMTGQHIDVLCADHPACYAITGWYDVYLLG